MKRALEIYVFSVVLFLSVAASAEQIDRIVAIVNDEPVTLYEVQKEQGNMAKMAGKNPFLPDGDKAPSPEAALNSLINQKLIAMKIKELDIKVSDDEVKQAMEDVKRQNNISQETLVEALKNQGISFEEYKSQLREQLEKLRLISMEVRSKIQISEKDIRDYYTTNPEKFEKEEIYHARLITLNIPADATEAEKKRIRDSISSIYAEAKSGKNFEELARKYSQDPSAKDGGDLGAFKKGEMLPEFDNVLAKLKPGEISEPFATQSGIHVVKLESRSHGELKPFENVKGEIADLLYKKKSEERFNQWLADLRKNALVDYRR
ncbi:MAG TPA: peptidylprolyl isomerase [Geobacteraceae bacterium]|nr:peptidylprolyl isomerase [Geobacteraceae bacterium]